MTLPRLGLFLALAVAVCSAQLAPSNPLDGASVRKPFELGAIVQGGNGFTDNREGFHFLMAGAHAGKVLTPNVGPGLLRGNFEYAVEVFPYWQSFTPHFQKVSVTLIPGTNSYLVSQPYTVGGTFTGASITPIMLRWNFARRGRFTPWFQGAGGVLYTTHKYPAYGNTDPLNLTANGPYGDASVWNFTPQAGIGAHYFTRPNRSIDFSVNSVHISSSSLGDRNPGVNVSLQASVGYTWWK
jgi:lipid A 3-O-deacylase